MDTNTTSLIYQRWLLSGLIVVFSSFIWLRLAQPQYLIRLRGLSDLVERDVDLNGLTPIQKAMVIRQQIYQNTPLNKTPQGYDFLDFARAYEEATTGQVGHICGGLAILYIAALESQGIPARYVGIFAETDDNHASVEFWDGERWLASDPTFNLMFSHRGEYLSWAQIWRLIQSGELPDFLGAQQPDRRIQDYYISFDDLVKHVVIHPATVEGVSFEMELYPASWSKGATLTPYEGVYEIMGRGLLR